MKDLRADDWEALALREPYFRVLNHEGRVETSGTGVPTDAFFETGETDIASLVSAVASVLGHDPCLTASLDFGCGAGRLTLPLARRSTRVVACDVAPTMLVHARQNVENAGLRNVTFIALEALSLLPRSQFDFVCSLLVFQYIPDSAGYAIIRTLLDLLAPSGVAALHMILRGPSTARARFLRRAAGFRSRDDVRSAYTDTNVYDERVVRRVIDDAGARLIGRFTTGQDEATGTVVIIEKPAARPNV